jgi:DNA (cytosine-5)-methyltransferase 1
MRVLDTFAGAGGFSLGFYLTGQYEIVGAIEKDAWACDTFQYNHPNTMVMCRSMEDMTDAEIKFSFPNIDIVLGGPPCQGFSIANKKALDPKDPRNSLFTEFIRVGKLLEPEVMILENVPNIYNALTADKKSVLDIIISELKKLNYHVYHAVLSATDYGVPQIRKRLFVIASKTALDNPFPKTTHAAEAQGNLFDNILLKTPTLWDAISDLPEIEAGQGEAEMYYTHAPITEYQKVLRKDSEIVYNHTAMQHSKRMVERFAAMNWGESVSDVPAHLKPLQRNGNGKISDTTYDQNNRRMFPFKPCHTIAASFYANFVHPYKHRNFTPREGARIQSFPDWYVFKGKPTVVSHKLLQREGRDAEKHLCQYNQIGNAVPPLLAKAIAQSLYKQIEKQTTCTFTETI